jgi:Zn-dependent protease
VRERSQKRKGAGGLVVGRFGGVPIVVRPGWLVGTAFLGLVFAPIAREAFPGLGMVGGYLAGLGFGFLLLVSLLLHELAHAWVARRRGVAVKRIVLTLVGGHTEMADAAVPGSSAVIAAAGPLANLGLAAVSWWGYQAAPDGSAVGLLLAMIASSNAFIGAFNLLPGLPMDGGWILEAVVWRLTGQRRTGTRAAAFIGRAVAGALLAVALVVPFLRGQQPDMTAVVWAVVIGLTLWTSAGDFLRLASWQGRVEGFDLFRIARPATQVPSTATLADLPDGAGGRGPDVVVVGPDGLVGYVDGGAFAAVPAARRAATPIDAVIVPLDPAALVDGSRTGREALQAVADVARFSPVMAVTGPDGVVAGLLRYAEVVEALRTGF